MLVGREAGSELLVFRCSLVLLLPRGRAIGPNRTNRKCVGLQPCSELRRGRRLATQPQGSPTTTFRRIND
jgi:hypothetical protein